MLTSTRLAMLFVLPYLLLLSCMGGVSGLDFGFDNLVKQDFSCSVEGAGGADACDASAATDGSSCVWCSYQSFGVCVSEDQASAMKKAIPGLTCDGDNIDDDDDTVINDDDDVPDDYWKCLKDFKDEKSCSTGSCSWCNTKAGYGICLDKKAAEKANDSDWFDCYPLFDPYDTTCLQSSIQGNEVTCEGTLDEDGQGCKWCTVGSANLCLTGDQGEIAEQFGGDCSSDGLQDPYGTTCLQASLQGDEATCDATVDEDGQGCEWCTVGSTNLCLNGDQAQIAEQLGGQCSSDGLQDPYGTTCLQSSIQGDEATCEATVDEDGQGCEWCTVGSANLCLNGDQAQIAEQFGGDCSSDGLQDPYGTTCLQASLQGDEATCEATVDEDGQVCEWCTVGSTNLCLNGDQAQIAEQLGGQCTNKSVKLLQ